MNIWYDAESNMGETHALFILNLMGHFPKYARNAAPITHYQAGDLSRCAVGFYFSTFYRDPSDEEHRLPQAFLNDVETSPSTLVWAGYNTWLLKPEKLRKIFGAEYQSLSELDNLNQDQEGFPGFFRYYSYKKEWFPKFARWDATDPSFLHAAYEISIYEVEDSTEVSVVSWARHSTNGEEVPYAIHKKNRWLFADSPFSYTYEEDRYLIFCDLLFDILNEPARWKKKPALMRLEDIHPRIPAWQLTTLSDYFAAEKIPYAMSLIPIFVDPRHVIVESNEFEFLPMSAEPLYLEYLKDVSKKGASFIFHGVSHSHGVIKNPWNSLSGDDFEFWNRPLNLPLAEDSPEYVVNRLEVGLSQLNAADIVPVAWLTPHYQASALDYHLFAKLFRWNVGRIIYMPHHLSGDVSDFPDSLRMDASGAAGNGKRLALLKNMRVTYPGKLSPNGQFYPYEINGDFYGENVIPEPVGNLQPYLNEQVFRVQTIDDLIRIVKRNRVLRDTWASFFLHPFRLEDFEHEGVTLIPGDLTEIKRLVAAIRESGYEFIDLKSWTTKPIPPPSPMVFIDSNGERL